ncbi:EmrB/QacA subfamily drug resistance transporter [Pedobacter cryoconitis]|uniref:EmrB/QacA subfamily drug resistance transporter n=1 Tax=Pedobacter cryoconitis TaxID=188932 RepID=A0A7W8YUP6_9SPHI|nr:MFS transporter [Pedobacter cryoconitis]MBB5621840.1 EmrB/QacA subfamily drug resistance transporter [Pedobacter cryoconitis]
MIKKTPFDQHKRQRRIILITVCIALMAVIASVSGLNVAQPKLAAEFNASQHTILWMINIYTISLAALLLPLGAVGDRLGRKPMLLAGLVIFGAASVMSGLTTSSIIMLAARLLSGIGAAMIMPVTLAVITSTFPNEERSKAIGVWTGVAGGGGILGMYLSAVLVDLANWRWLFALPILLAIVAIALTLRFIPDSREKTVHRFDIVGSLLSIIAMIGIVFTLHEAPGQGWDNPMALISLIIGIAAVFGFVLWELRQQEPLLDIRLFRKRGLSSGSVSLLTIFGVQAGIFVVLFPYFQGVLGWSGLRSTLAMMPMALLMMLASGLAPVAAARIGSRSTMAVGVIFGGVGAALMATLVSVDGGYLSVLPGMLAMGFGMGLTMTPSTEAIILALPIERQGVASALNDVTRELGTALGVALLGALVTAGYSNAIDRRLDQIPTGTAALAREGIANALIAAEGAGSQSAILIRIARESFVYGWQQAMWAGAGVMAILFVYILARGPRTVKANQVVNE